MKISSWWSCYPGPALQQTCTLDGAVTEQLSISLNKLPCPNFSVHKQEEDKEKNFVCDICGYRTDRKQNLTKHNKVHNKKKCPFCDYLAVSKNYIELHIDKRH